MGNVWRAQSQVMFGNCELGWLSQQLQQGIVIYFVAVTHACFSLGSMVWLWFSLVHAFRFASVRAPVAFG